MPVLSQIVRRPSLGYYYAQKSIRSIPVRTALGGAVARILGRPATAPGSAAADVAAQLRRDGISFLPPETLTASALDSVRSFLKGKPLTDPYGSQGTFDIDGVVPPHLSRLFYRPNDVLGCQSLVNLANSPLVLDTVGELLGSKPTIALMQAWWTLGEHHRDGAVHHDDVYHRDVDDFRFVKLFVYLTDTHRNNGAHSYVRGSHLSDRFTRRGPITDDEVHGAFSPQDILTIEGPAGTVFLENTWGIHRPLLATEGRRLIFSVLYTLTPWTPETLATPVLALPDGLDPYINRAIFRP